MAWEHLQINQPHLVYLVLGGFTTLFMLCSSVIKERFYIGEATVATICGIIFGPHAANVINPLQWGNTDQITLEFARIVLVVQCFAVGVELPKAYMEKHWRSVVLLLIPVMTFGWLITSLFIWWLFMNRLDWLDSLVVAACVTATDPVLASSVVGKGKFAKRVPKHLRDLLSCESGCNDGMAFPFVYLGVYIIRYRPDANAVSLHWFCYTILYECVFGAFYGVIIGYLARRGIRYAHEHKLIDRESFLVFYFVLALFCAGSGAVLGLDDLLVGFACGVGFSNDGWFQEKTEETHVSNVIDLLINLAFFVYFGAIIPWSTYNSSIIGVAPWQLVVLSIFVVLFRRIPIMVMLKPVIPDIKTWREALFAGHFGPIGVGALFIAILARAELETETTTPLAVLPPPDFPHDNIIELIWPITTFLVIVSIIIHGSSVAVFTLGKHINTLTITMSYTQMNEDGPSWMDRLPRIQSRSKSSMARGDDTDSLYDEKLSGPDGLPTNFLRRQKEGDNPSRSSSRRGQRRRKKWDHGIGPGGPISQSAIAPQRRKLDTEESRTDSETLAPDSSDQSPTKEKRDPTRGSDEEPGEEIYEEGDQDIIEDEDGNVLKVEDSRADETPQDHDNRLKKEATELGREKHVRRGKSHNLEDGEEGEDGRDADDDELERMGSAIKEGVENIPTTWKGMRKRMGTGLGGLRRMGSHVEGPPKAEKAEPSKQKRGAALAYQFGNTIIVEDEDGEVLKKYDIPTNKTRPKQVDRQGTTGAGPEEGGRMQKLARMGSYFGFQHGAEAAEAGPSRGEVKRKYSQKINEGEDDDDRHIRFTLGAGGRRMSKNEFIEQIQKMDPRARATLVENSDAPEPLKKEVRQDAREHHARVSARQDSEQQQARRPKVVGPHASRAGSEAQVRKVPSHEDQATGPNGLTLVDSDLDEEIPFHDVHDDLDEVSFGQGGKETAAAARRRRLASGRSSGATGGETEDGGRADKASRVTRGRAGSSSYFGSGGSSGSAARAQDNITSDEDEDDQVETAAERRRRQEVLGEVAEGEEGQDSDSEEEVGTGFRKLDRIPTTNSLGGKPSNRETARSNARQASSLAIVQEATQEAASGVRQPEPSYQGSTTEPTGQRMSIRFADGVRREGDKNETQDNQEEVGTDSSTRRSRLRWSDLKKKL